MAISLSIPEGRLHPTYTDDEVLSQVEEIVNKIMSAYDASHDSGHIVRVRSMADKIYAAESEWEGRRPDKRLVDLVALVHDLDDRKYHDVAASGVSRIRETLAIFVSPAVAETVEHIAKHVSYSFEKANDVAVRRTCHECPELRIVQDADRLDAIGAIGLARLFTYGATKGRSFEGTLQHKEDKLIWLASMMKTKTGAKMALVRTKRLDTFSQWWTEEMNGDS